MHKVRFILLLCLLINVSNFASANIASNNINEQTVNFNCDSINCHLEIQPQQNFTLNSSQLNQLAAQHNIIIDANSSHLTVNGDEPLLLNSNHNLTINAASIAFNSSSSITVSGQDSRLKLVTNQIKTPTNKPNLFVNNGAFVRIYQHPKNFANFKIFNVQKDQQSHYINAVTIRNLSDLKQINNNLSANYILLNNIDGQGVTFKSIGEFQGKFFGLHHIISNLIINPHLTSSALQPAFFIAIATNAIVSDLGLQNINASFAANNYGTITHCFNQGFNLNLPPANYYDIGGLVDDEYTGKIDHSYASGNIISQGNQDIGGLIGNNMGGTVNNSYAAVNISSDPTYLISAVGGFVGENVGTGQITRSYSSGNITANAVQIGGFMGSNAERLISNCYATGNVENNGTSSLNKGGSSIGGFIGTNVANVSYIYSLGKVTVDNAGAIATGGVIGYQATASPLPNSYWDIDTSGLNVAYGNLTNKSAKPIPLGLSDSQMKQQQSFADWDFTKTWGINEGVSYPYLQWQTKKLSEK